MECQRNESEGRRAHGDEHRTKSEDGGVDKSRHQVFALFPVLFDGFEKHNNMADNHAHKTGDSQKCPEAEGLTRCVERRKCTDAAERNRREYNQRFRDITELEHEGKIDR
jgi:hypothetical protein